MRTKLLSVGLKTFFLGGFLLWTVVPVGLVISNSFKTQLDIFSVPPTVFFVPTLENYVRALTSGDFGRYFLNSLLVGATSSLLSVGFGAFAAYSIVSLLLPLFAIMNLTGLLGTYVGPILAHTAINLPFVIWLVMGFIQDIPEDLESAAKIDGCTRMQIFWMIVSPLIMPGLAASAILSMQYSWNELLFSLQLTNLDTYTLPVGISKFVGSISVDWGKSSAAATMTMVPMILLGFFVQKYLARGTVGGAIKG
jgi:multiple sugar transport system permease protein